MRMLPLFSIVAASIALLPAVAQAFTIKSADMGESGRLAAAQVSNVFGCQGGNVSPEVSWQGVPDGTRSFAVTLYDPDAPTGSGFWHWVVANIPATATGLPRGAGSGAAALPNGTIQAANDAGVAGYVGACPPPGAPHRYILTVYALKVPQIDVSKMTSGALVGFMTKANSLGEASLTALYGR